jgi:hypothetical protein
MVREAQSATNEPRSEILTPGWAGTKWVIFCVGLALLVKLFVAAAHGDSRSLPPWVQHSLFGVGCGLVVIGVASLFPQGRAPLEIKSDKSSNFYVKVVREKGSRTVAMAYIRGGDTVRLGLPSGEYWIKWAAGVEWINDRDLFGPHTQYGQADKTFTFSRTLNQFSGYTITLYNVAQGNLRTSQINKAQFEG